MFFEVLPNMLPLVASGFLFSVIGGILAEGPAQSSWARLADHHQLGLDALLRAELAGAAGGCLVVARRRASRSR